ncbi:hypothetical protein ACIQ9E_07300 [Streptomyces sp. NPDC094448]|uniref:hypothetical protein n=1 Tax=Streptomyces sp. NPDC094448 TaxID=3366063 RepID=UPI00382CEC5F
MPALWLDILRESGAVAALRNGSLPAGERPRDGAAGWLRAAGRLRAELAEAGRGLRAEHDVGLVDLLLSLDVPVAGPDTTTVSS